MELKEIIKRTNKADPTSADRQALEKYIAEGGRDEIARIGRLHVVVSEKMGRLLGNYLVRVAVDERMAVMQRELGYETASPLEQMLIDNILLTWFRYHSVELFYGEVANQSSQQALLWERRLNLAHQRHLRSIEALARVRRLLYKPSNNVAFNFLLKQQLGG